MPKLSIIIPTVGKRNVLIPTLERLKSAIGGHDVEVIVIDDSPASNLKDSEVAPFLVLKGGGKGAANARNLGWKAAKAPLLLFLDDDIWITKKHLARTLLLHQEKSAKAFNFFWTYPNELMEQLESRAFGQYILKRKLYSNEHRLDFDPKQKTGLVEMKGLTSQYFSIEKRWIEAAGGYDRIPFAGIEDLLLYQKLEKRGVLVFLSLDDIVYQYEVNKLTSDSLVSRYRTGALTRRVAVNQGHSEHGVHFNQYEKAKGKVGNRIEPLLKAAEKLFPFGKVYERVVNYRLFVATYRGFYLDELPSDFTNQSDKKGRQSF